MLDYTAKPAMKQNMPAVFTGTKTSKAGTNRNAKHALIGAQTELPLKIILRQLIR
jgi:hypothetical protein